MFEGTIKHTMGTKSDIDWLVNKYVTPGSGKYEVVNLNKKGNYKVAKYKNSKATKINPPTSDRFSEYNKLC